MTERKVRLLGDRMSRGTAWRLARERDWSTLRDAEYLAVTRLRADALVTVDPELAAKAQDVVPVAPLEALLTAG
jgi:predicted nucleic acid-binding protein